MVAEARKEYRVFRVVRASKGKLEFRVLLVLGRKEFKDNKEFKV